MTKCIECGAETQIGYQRCHSGPYCLACSKKPVEEWEDELQNVHEKDHPPVPSANETDIVFRLRKRAEIRRQISTRKSVQEGKPDRIADLLEEAAMEIKELEAQHKALGEAYDALRDERDELNRRFMEARPAVEREVIAWLKNVAGCEHTAGIEAGSHIPVVRP